MLKGFDKKNEMRNVLVTEEGKVVVSVDNSQSSPIPVSGDVAIESLGTTLYSGVMTVGTEEQTIGVSKKVTEISIANYSETANVTVSVDESNFVVGPNIATDLPIGKNVSTVGLSATEANTKVQYIIKGAE